MTPPGTRAISRCSNPRTRSWTRSTTTAGASIRAHQRDLGPRGYITTEFLDDVGWQREPYASLNDATGFHIQEGRWLRDRRYAGDYIDFMYEGGGNDRHFAEAIADATFARFLVDGDQDAATRHLGAMKHIYALWDDHYDFDKKLYWIEPLLDATEYTISSIDASGGKDGFRGGDAFRPSINSYMYANARAISRLAALTGDAADRRRLRRPRRRPEGPGAEEPVEPGLRPLHRPLPGQQRAREVLGPDPRPRAGRLPALDLRPARRHARLRPGLEARDRPERTGRPGRPAHGRAVVRILHAPVPLRRDRARVPVERAGLAVPDHPGADGPGQPAQRLRQDVVTRADYARMLAQYTQLHFKDGKPDLEEDYDPATGKAIVGLAAATTTITPAMSTWSSAAWSACARAPTTCWRSIRWPPATRPIRTS
jgi:hypothetical protein